MNEIISLSIPQILSLNTGINDFKEMIINFFKRLNFSHFIAKDREIIFIFSQEEYKLVIGVNLKFINVLAWTPDNCEITRVVIYLHKHFICFFF